jgi:hypothetical protein
MARDADDVFSDAHPLGHDLRTALTVICGQTQLLQRHLGRMERFSDGDRARLAQGLGVILGAARTLRARMGTLPGTRREHDASSARERRSPV